MKIGILTFHRANNLGAVLQASALLQYMQDHHGDSELIDFYPNNVKRNTGTIKRFFSRVKRLILFPTMAMQIKKEKRFAAYREKYFELSEETFYGDTDIRQAAPAYDVLVSGSDQIFNATLTGNTSAYYLDFDNRAKKISYASSFGRTELSPMEIRLVKQELPNFFAVSVREQSAADIIKRETGLAPSLVVDPVFLLDADIWSSRCNSGLKLPEKYIFVYSMEVSENLEMAVNAVANASNLPVIVVRGGGQPGRIPGREDPACGPEEFLRYIKDAELVITNSFHGTAFATIFQKKFLCIAHSSRNARLENLMRMIGKENALITDAKKAAKPCDHAVDGSMAWNEMIGYIEKSKAYLRDLL